jgi:hypothetical protein
LKLGRSHWKAKLGATRKLWREMRPNERQRGAYAGRKDFSFESIRALAANIDFAERVNAWQMGDDSWSIRVRGEIYDIRVSTVNSQLVGRDVTGLYMLDFDVLAASSLMDGQAVPYSPLIGIQASNAEVASHLADYCLRMDRIWAFFGGASIDNLPTLAIWMIQNRQAVGASDASVSMVCAAFVYGEKALSLDLLAEYERGWKRRMQFGISEEDIFPELLIGTVVLEPSRESLQEIGTEALAEAARLRDIIERRHLT